MCMSYINFETYMSAWKGFANLSRNQTKQIFYVAAHQVSLDNCMDNGNLLNERPYGDGEDTT